jgi:hypothetical protein
MKFAVCIEQAWQAHCCNVPRIRDRKALPGRQKFRGFPSPQTVSQVGKVEGLAE